MPPCWMLCRVSRGASSRSFRTRGLADSRMELEVWEGEHDARMQRHSLSPIPQNGCRISRYGGAGSGGGHVINLENELMHIDQDGYRNRC